MSYYLQITTKCNMKCDHCCFSCRPGKGSDMDLATVSAALRFLEREGKEYLTIGGGEPTIHKNFMEVIEKVRASNLEYAWMATNGKKTKTIWELIRAVQEQYDYDDKPKIEVALSQDPWHDPINPEIVEFFNRRAKESSTFRTGKFQVRDVSRNFEGLIKAGRAKRTEPHWFSTATTCTCDSRIIKPWGEIRACGCPDSPVIGNVFDGITYDEPMIASKDEFDNWEDALNYNGCFRGKLKPQKGLKNL